MEPPAEEIEDDAAITYSVEVIVAALVVVGQFIGPVISFVLRCDIDVPVVLEAAAAPIVIAVVPGVDSEPFACSNDSSVLVDLSAVALADALAVVHLITGRGLLVTLLKLLLLVLALTKAVVAYSLLPLPWEESITVFELNGAG